MEIQLFSKGKWSIGRPIITEESPWFKGKEVATSLEFGNVRDALYRHVEPEDKASYAKLTNGVSLPDALRNQQPHEIYINEVGIYSLVLRCNKPRAKHFKRWITREVLPSIRSFV